MKRVALLMIGLILWTICVPKHDANKSLAIMELGRETGPELVYLANDYGFLIYWLDNKEPELYIYNKPANKIKMTSDFSEFLTDLQRFPNGVKVDRIRGCGITEMGMPEDYKEQLRQIIKEKEFYLTDIEDSNFSVCQCQTTYVRRFKTTNQSIQPQLWQHDFFHIP